MTFRLNKFLKSVINILTQIPQCLSLFLVIIFFRVYNWEVIWIDSRVVKDECPLSIESEVSLSIRNFFRKRDPVVPFSELKCLVKHFIPSLFFKGVWDWGGEGVEIARVFSRHSLKLVPKPLDRITMETDTLIPSSRSRRCSPLIHPVPPFHFSLFPSLPPFRQLFFLFSFFFRRSKVLSYNWARSRRNGDHRPKNPSWLLLYTL